ncbi:endonuclease/exonuclease/phosphatase family protein [Alloscardovia macacae]|uniref:Endonuclease n=1 Tax=Alloscardovia macacae TaxID=1160091 RepID=A0A261F7G6_9BIFI|nr:endonuclease/exonuclease/phosphatase family protein [Alloscardovia macacae]OZG54973.1 endonuclease [Alloscardovia macacae]
MILTAVLWTALALTAVWMLLRYLPVSVDATYPLPYLNALTPLLAAPLVVLAVLAAASHRPGAFWTAAVLLAVHLLWALTFWLPLPSAVLSALGSPRQSAQTSVSSGFSGQFSVMTVNVMHGRADASAILHQAKLLGVDVLAVQEVNDSFVERFHSEGALTVFPHEQLGEKTHHDNAGYNALWSRLPVAEASGALLEGMGSNTPVMTVSVGSEQVRIVSAHPYSPHRSLAQWHSDIATLGELAGSGPAAASIPTVVMGDLNSSTFHPVFRSVVDAGLLDSSLELHAGPHTTFPASWALMPPVIEIDHVLHTRELVATSVQTVQIPRTDHKALISTLQWK